MRNKRNKSLWVRADKLKVHPTAQRHVVASKRRKIADNLDLDGIGTMHIVDYPIAGIAGPWVVDGQHRLLALLDNDCGEWPVHCELHVDVADDARASTLFLMLNDRTIVGPFDKWENEVQSADATANGAKEIIENHGLVMRRFVGDGNIACPETAKRLYSKDGGQLFDETLTVALAAFGAKSEAVEGKLLEGLAIVLGQFNGEVDRPSLIKKLAKTGAASLHGEGKSLAKLRRESTARGIAQVIVDVYNSRRAVESRLALK